MREATPSRSVRPGSSTTLEAAVWWERRTADDSATRESAGPPPPPRRLDLFELYVAMTKLREIGEVTILCGY